MSTRQDMLLLIEPQRYNLPGIQEMSELQILSIVCVLDSGVYIVFLF